LRRVGLPAGSAIRPRYRLPRWRFAPWPGGTSLRLTAPVRLTRGNKMYILSRCDMRAIGIRM